MEDSPFHYDKLRWKYDDLDLCNASSIVSGVTKVTEKGGSTDGEATNTTAKVTTDVKVKKNIKKTKDDIEVTNNDSTSGTVNQSDNCPLEQILPTDFSQVSNENESLQLTDTDPTNPADNEKSSPPITDCTSSASDWLLYSEASNDSPFYLSDTPSDTVSPSAEPTKASSDTGNIIKDARSAIETSNQTSVGPRKASKRPRTDSMAKGFKLKIRLKDKSPERQKEASPEPSTSGFKQEKALEAEKDTSQTNQGLPYQLPFQSSMPRQISVRSLLGQIRPLVLIPTTPGPLAAPTLPSPPKRPCFVSLNSGYCSKNLMYPVIPAASFMQALAPLKLEPGDPTDKGPYEQIPRPGSPCGSPSSMDTGSTCSSPSISEDYQEALEQLEQEVHAFSEDKHGQTLHHCNACNRVFAVLTAFKSHVRTHLKHGNKCHICGKVFSRSWLLKGHQRVHTGERPYRCGHPGCDRAFADKSNLRSHRRTHEVPKQMFECSNCHRTFAQKRYLHKHQHEVCFPRKG